MSRYVFSICDRCGKESYSPHTTCDGEYHDGDGVYMPLPDGWMLTPDQDCQYLLCPKCAQDYRQHMFKFFMDED